MTQIDDPIESAVAPEPVEPSADQLAEEAHQRRRFWTAGEGVAELADPTPFGNENALQKLGRPPFEKSARSKFRLLGFLATVYEHVSQDVGGTSRGADGVDGGGEVAEEVTTGTDAIRSNS